MKAFGLAVLVFLVGSFSSGYPRPGYGGGDGPHPVEDFEYSTELIDARGGLKEFLVLPDAQRLIYRNNNDQLLELFDSNLIVPKVIGSSLNGISEVRDPAGRYLAANELQAAYDLKNQAWIKAQGLSGVTHLYWKGENLYSLRTLGNVFGQRYFEFYRYSAGNGVSTRICGFAENPEYPIRLVKGQSYPDVTFYTLQRAPYDTANVLEFAFNVRNCDVVSSGPVIAQIRRPVLDVIRFEKYGAYGIQVNDPRENFIWNTHKLKGHIINLGTLPLIVPDFDQTILVSLDPERALRVIFLDALDYPQEAKEARVLQNLPITSLRARDVMMQGPKKLFLAPQLKGETTRWLMKMTFGKQS